MPEDAKVHVGNLSFDTREEDLRDEFERYGRIEQVQIIKDRDTGRPRGYGFVMFESIEDCKDAIRDMDQRTFLGRCIKCEKARPRRSDSGGGYRAPRDSFDRRDFDIRDDRRGGRRDDYRRDDYKRNDFRSRDDFRGDFRRDDRDFRRDDRGFGGRDDRDFRGRRDRRF